MAEKVLLKSQGGIISEFASTDTIPDTAMPAVSVIAPSQITSTQNNYHPTGWADADIVRLDFDTTGRGITGFTAWTNTRQKRLVNTSGNPGYIPCEHPNSSAANRVIGVCDHIIEPYGTLVLEYDSTSSRIRVVANSFNPAAAPMSGRGLFYHASPGATLGSDWGTVGFGISGGDNGTNVPTATLPGAWEIHTSTSATGVSSLYFSKSIVSPAHPQAGHTVTSCMVYFPTLSDGTQTFTFAFGIATSNSTTLNLSNQVEVRYSHALNSGKFLGVNRSGSTENTVDLGITVAVNTPYVLTICIDKPRSESRFYIDGVFVGRQTSTVPSANLGQRIIIVKTAGTTQRSAFIASMMLFQVY